MYKLEEKSFLPSDHKTSRASLENNRNESMFKYELYLLWGCFYFDPIFYLNDSSGESRLQNPGYINIKHAQKTHGASVIQTFFFFFTLQEKETGQDLKWRIVHSCRLFLRRGDEPSFQ